MSIALTTATMMWPASAQTGPSDSQSNCLQVGTTSSVSVVLPNQVEPQETLVVAIHSTTPAPAPQTVTDSLASVFTPALSPVADSGTLSQVWVATAQAQGFDTVTVQLAVVAAGEAVYVHVYRGLDPINPVVTSATGAGNTSSSFGFGPVTTAEPGVLFAQAAIGSRVASVDLPFVSRQTCWGDMTADQIISSGGTYSVSFSSSASGHWIGDLVALRTPASADGGTPPTPDSFRTLTVGCACESALGTVGGGLLAGLLVLPLLRPRRAASGVF
jgi:hypothetical protein